MTIVHICAGWQKWNGAANIARIIMDEQRREGHEVSFATWAKARELRAADEVWIHCGWLPCLWWDAIWGRNVHWMPEACYDPVRLHFHAWKKWLVGPMERWCLRRCDRIVATCEAEKGWIQSYLGKHCPPIEVTDIKRFFNLNPVNPVNPVRKNLHLLYLGRRHPLKCLSYFETAVRQIQESSAPPRLCARIISSAFGAELEKVWDWCDVLVLPTLSDNFGLVIAEALERGKRVITTDGAPAWGEGLELGVGSGGVESGGVGERVDCVYADIRFVKDDLLTTSRYYSAKHWKPWMLQWGKMPPHPSVYIRRKLFDQYGFYKLGYDIAADYELLIRYLRMAGIKTRYLNECVVRMRMGGKSTRGWKSFMTLNKEIVRGNLENGYFCCFPMLLPKYLFKIFEFILPRLGFK